MLPPCPSRLTARCSPHQSLKGVDIVFLGVNFMEPEYYMCLSFNFSRVPATKYQMVFFNIHNCRKSLARLQYHRQVTTTQIRLISSPLTSLQQSKCSHLYTGYVIVPSHRGVVIPAQSPTSHCFPFRRFHSPHLDFPKLSTPQI